MFVAAFAKEILQNCHAFILQHTRNNIASVIEARHLQKIDYTSRSTANGICATENHAPNSRVHERACAHRAGLLGHVKIAIAQSPITYGCLSLRQRQHFGMRSGILQQFHLIMRAPDDFAFANNNRADRNFASYVRFLSLSQCFAHKVLVVWWINHHC